MFGIFFFELCNSLITTLYILFPCTFLFVFVLSNNISLMLRPNIGSVGSFRSLLSFLLPSLALTAGVFDAFFELSSILWAFAWLISHHILISERISLGRGQTNTPASPAVRYNHPLGDETHMAQADESNSTYLPGNLASHPGRVQEEFPSSKSAVSMASWIFFCFSLWSDAVMV